MKPHTTAEQETARAMRLAEWKAEENARIPWWRVEQIMIERGCTWEEATLIMQREQSDRKEAIRFKMQARRGLG